MVFESIVVDVLNRFIGDYVQVLDRSQLSLGIWGGDVVLENLDIKENALAGLDLPMTIVKGRLEKLVLKIPWKNLYNSPVVASVEGLYLLVAPTSGTTYDAEKEKKSKWEAKQKQLQKIEEAKIREAVKQTDNPTEDSFTEKLVAQIMKNLQVRISCIHVRYEDSYTNASQPFAAGITLHNLFFETTDWSADSSPKFIYKLITLASLSLYFDTLNVHLFSNLDSSEIYRRLKSDIPTDDNNPNLCFVLNPIHSSVKLRLNPKPETDGTDYTTPKTFLSLDMQQFVLCISKSQFQCVTKLLASIERMSLSSLWRQYRPNKPIIGNCALWWKFAYTCIVEEGVRRKKRNWSWSHMQEHRQGFKAYKEAYLQKLINKKLTDELKKKIESFEEIMDVFSLTLARKLAEMEYARLEPSEKDKESYTGKVLSWFSWKSKKKNEDEVSIAKRFEDAMSGDEKNKLYAAIGYQENAAPTTYPTFFVENYFKFHLNNLSINVIDDSLRNPEVLHFSLDKVSTSLKMRPSASAIRMESFISSFTVYGHQDSGALSRPIIIQSVTGVESDEPKNLLNFLFETNPESGGCDQRVHVFAQPLEIVYHALSIQHLSDVFKSSDSVELTGLQEEARSTMQQFTENSATGLQHAILTQKVLELKVDVQSSYVIIPENGVYNEGCSVIVAQFGHLKMESVPRVHNAVDIQALTRAGSTEEEKLKEMFEQSYDKFNLELAGVQVLVAGRDVNWKMVKDTDSDLHVLMPLSIRFSLHKCIIREDPRLPNLLIHGELPYFCLHISDKKIFQLATLAFSFPNSLEDDSIDTLDLPSSIKKVNRSRSMMALESLSKKDLIALSSTKVNPTESQLGPTQQLTKLELSFAIKKVQLLLAELNDPLLDFTINQVELKFKQKDFEMNLNTSVHSLLVNGKLSQNSSVVKMIYTPDSDCGGPQMLSFSYCNVNRKAPEFSTTHRSVEQLIKLNFAKLNVVLHQDVLLKMISFANDIQFKLESLKPKTEVDKFDILRRSTSTIASVYEYAKDAVGPRIGQKRIRKTKEDIINLQADISLHCFSIHICSSLKPISDISIHGLNVAFKMRKSCNEVQVQLINLSVADPNSGVFYKQILSFADEDAFSVTVVTYNDVSRGKSRGNVDAVDLSLKASVGSVTFVFLNKYISELMCFVNCFQVAKDKVAEVSVAAAKSASENVREAYHKASRAKLDFHLKSPIVIIPQHSVDLNAIVVNLGSIMVSNSFHKIPSTDSGKDIPIVERIKISLDNFELLRAVFGPDVIEKRWERTLLLPVSFQMHVTRNLSISWYTELPEVDVKGTLGVVQLGMSNIDYCTVMNILNQNFSEGEVVETKTVNTDRLASASDDAILNTLHVDNITKDASPFKRLTFSFNLEKFVILLSNSSISKFDNELNSEPLAKFEFFNLTTKGEIWSHNKINASVKLSNCIWDDTRISRNRNGIIRLLQQLGGSTSVEDMVKIEFIQQPNSDKQIDLNVRSFNLVFWVDYLMLLAQFFQPQDSSLNTVKANQPSKTPIKQAPKKSSDAVYSGGTTIVKLKINKPEIVVVVDADDIDTPTIVFENEIDLKLTSCGSSQNLMLTISKLQLFSSIFNPPKRLANLVEVLSPCEIGVVINKTLEKTNINVNCSPMSMHIAPYTVKLLSSISSSFKSPPKDPVSDAVADVDYSDEWAVKEFDPENFWFLKTEVGEEALEISEEKNVVTHFEQLVIEAKSIVVTIEAQIGVKIIPMIALEANFLGDVRNWSGLLGANCSLSLEASYFNKRLDVWEPLIETVDDAKGRSPWELLLEIKRCDKNEKFGELLDEDVEEVEFEPPVTSVNIYSKYVLEMTVTKSSLEVITNLGTLFSDAIKEKDESYKKDLYLAPYSVQNNAGTHILLNLEGHDFEVVGENSSGIKDVLLEPGAVASLNLKNVDVESNRKSILQEQDTVHEHALMFRIVEMDVVRTLLITRSEKRYFPLPHRTYPGDQWGLVTEIIAKDGCKIITFRSSVQVENHLNVAVEVYYMTEGGNELKFCGEVEAYSKLNLPLTAVYTPTNEIFFRPKGNKYSVSIIPFVWKELLQTSVVTKILKCESKESGQLAFFLNAIGEMKKILYENTRKKTLPSTCFNIHLYPSVLFCNLLPKPIACTLQGPYEEMVLAEGQTIQLLNAEVNISPVTFKIPEYMDLEWKCVKVLSQQMEAVWTFEAVGSKLTLDLGCMIKADEGFLQLTLYCPFWMINKTSQMLYYRRSKKGEKHLIRGSPAKNDDPNLFVKHAPNNQEPVLFSFKPKVFFSKKMASIKVGESEWSDKFTLDTVGSSGCVSCSSKNGLLSEVGVEIRLSSTGLTKIVIFTPYYLLVNNTRYNIFCREYSSKEDWIEITAGQCEAMWPKFSTSKKELVFRIANTSEETKPVKYSESHSTLLALNNSKGGLNVDCHLTECSCVIAIDSYTQGMSNVLLMNHCHNVEINFNQSGSKSVPQTLKPKELLYYTWDDPNGPKELTWSINSKLILKNTLLTDGIGEYDLSENESVFWVSFLDNVQRVILFTDDLAIATNAQCTYELERNDLDLNINLPGIGISIVDDLLRREVMYLALTSSGVVWESAKIKGSRWAPMNIKDNQILENAYNKYNNELKLSKKPKSRQILDGRLEIDFSNEMMFRPCERKVRRTYQTGLSVQYMSSPHNMQFHLKINRLQIDNQLFECVFPTVFAPVPLPKTVAAESVSKSFIEACIILRLNEGSRIKYFKYFKVLVQEFSIKLDQGFINALITLFQQPSSHKHDKIELLQADVEIARMNLKQLVTITSSQEMKNFYHILHFSPIKINISFSMQGGESDPKKPSTIHAEFVNVLLQSFGVTLTEIQDVVFRLGFFEKQHVFMSEKQLKNEVVQHYTAQAVKQMYVLILGLDVLGNPFGLVMGLGKGIEDFFYEPFQGAVQGPEEFAEGLALGIRSLLGHTVGGAAGVFSRITGTLGKGVAALTMDDDYQKKRREALNKKPANLQQGLAQSGKGLVMGVYDGVTGVFVKPIEGAKQEGFGGFFKGLGKGAVGLVARPASGVMDFASGSFDAVKRVADLSEVTLKVRPSRYFQADGRVRPYIKIEAEGNNLLLELDKGRYAVTDNYIAHAVVTEDGRVVLLVTDKRVIMISKGDIFGQWNCEWNFTWEDLSGLPQPHKNGLLIQLKTSKKGKKVLGLFGKDMSSKLVDIQNQEMVHWIIQKISLAMTMDA